MFKEHVLVAEALSRNPDERQEIFVNLCHLTRHRVASNAADRNRIIDAFENDRGK